MPFPFDRFGQAVGYKTDHDPRQRATSVGPYTSREMCRALIAEARRRQIRICEGRTVVGLTTVPDGRGRRAAGAVAVNADGEFEVFGAENVVFAVGGPGGLYDTSVYPVVHTGAIGLALLAGARAQSLPESQYGMASVKFRWNVSGTYMQVVPRFVSTDASGGDEQEFLRPYFASAGEMNSMVFLKGYQWPFDPRKAVKGSSLIDILVYAETVLKGRRVFLDYRSEAAEFSFDSLSEEAQTYLRNSRALEPTPIKRLETMNPGAVQLYLEHGIDLRCEPLEIAVCAQHNNGGLAANHWWESANIKHFFPVGEVNGSHGVYRPGGSALNSGQVERSGRPNSSARAIAKLRSPQGSQGGGQGGAGGTRGIPGTREKRGRADLKEERSEFRRRMSAAAAHVRDPERLKEAVREARAQWRRLAASGCVHKGAKGRIEALRTFQLCFAHLVYLEAVRFQIESGSAAAAPRWSSIPRGDMFIGSSATSGVLRPRTTPSDKRCSKPMPAIPASGTAGLTVAPSRTAICGSRPPGRPPGGRHLLLTFQVRGNDIMGENRYPLSINQATTRQQWSLRQPSRATPARG